MKFKTFFACVIIAWSAHIAQGQFPIKNLNVIIFTADDLGADETGVGAFGAKIKGITPNLDKVSKAGVRFYNAHVNSAICVPSRGILGTGKYGFNSHQHGFFYAPDSTPTLIESFQKKVIEQAYWVKFLTLPLRLLQFGIMRWIMKI